jgi:hypothetical protein
MEGFMSNKHLPRLFAQALNEKRVELFDEFVHPEYNNHNPQVQPRPAGVKELFRHYLGAFPDTKVVMEDVIEEGESPQRPLYLQRNLYETIHGLSAEQCTGAAAEHRHLAR